MGQAGNFRNVLQYIGLMIFKVKTAESIEVIKDWSKESRDPRL